jgi:hypothetical protein
MSVAELIGKITTRKRQQELERVGDYRQLVKAVARGREADPDQAAAAMEAAGKSAADLEHDVAHEQRRQGMRAQLDRLPGLEKELADTEAEFEALRQEYDRIYWKHRNEGDRLRERLNHLRSQVDTARNQRDDLFRTADDPAVLEASQALQAEADRLYAEAERLREQLKLSTISGGTTEAIELHKAEGALRELLRNSKADPHEVNATRQCIERLKAALAPVHDRLAAIDKRREEIAREQRALYEKAVAS